MLLGVPEERTKGSSPGTIDRKGCSSDCCHIHIKYYFNYDLNCMTNYSIYTYFLIINGELI